MNPEDMFKGSDMVISVGGKEIGKVQGIDFSTRHDTQQIHTLGDPSLRGFSRGKEEFSGTLKMVGDDDQALDALRISERFGAGILNGRGIATAIENPKGYINARNAMQNKHQYKNVLILPIDGMTKKDLFEFIPRPDDVFQLERLAKLNPNVFPYNKGEVQVISWSVLDEGIVGAVIIKSVQ